ncbi:MULTISPECIES: 5-formyltetrahydrofolate cyclo-ligase [unclassified Modestobacter]|uniref:5-formyltetrahydrofolate cyclo-ligase n=1 Tax=unclassified Modestobacter TaxID=2643866 RepID=UPI0022AAF8E4|nr:MULTISPECIES: 5-formyltetrahydrofolate cyclo-ligase [unclassified Modestobacter]MCZ2825201.1 5-formyltetrahydrofolate cyclo-ligase [Modestobacter sp. VKM Ac-2981]MCZ2853734.1 5-formyltetrahydrofolate cyclo-ligase [Modestobacter sp. VKM Ac-2982]
MAESPEVVRAKATLRATLLARRADRSPAARAAAADALATALAGRLAGTSVTAAYVPAAEEPGAGRLPDALPGRLLLPVVPARGRELSWAEHDGRLVPGRFGLQEPTGPRLPPGALAEADVVVVPALAVAADGTRLGRGGGYYDRALAHARPGATLVAVLFDEEFVDQLPAGPHDRRVTAVVTPSAGWWQLD